MILPLHATLIDIAAAGVGGMTRTELRRVGGVEGVDNALHLISLGLVRESNFRLYERPFAGRQMWRDMAEYRKKAA